MTESKLAQSKTAARRVFDAGAPDLHFLRSVFAELTGEAQRGAVPRPASAAPSQPRQVVRTPSKPVE